MKFSEKWLREWVNPPINTEQLTQQLTMAGFELESMVSTAPAFKDVVIGEVLSAERHPDADRLKLCQVNVGQAAPLQIVCGGPNVRVGLKVAVVLVDGFLSDPKNSIKKTKLRGVESHGMICSERELGLSDQQDGSIMELPNDAPVGMTINAYLNLDDRIIDVAITPNRGDCLSMLGIAREVSALNHLPLQAPKPPTIQPSHTDTIQVRVSAPEACPRYLGCVIRDIKPDAQTPIAMRERLRRSGIRCLHPVVDVMNYVMLELGQPLHAFDLDQLNPSLEVRFANEGETVTLLDNKTVTLTKDTLVIADQKQVQAIAGVMGAVDAAVQPNTQHIFLESAFFTPGKIAATARRLGLATESAARFERGVDYDLQKLALTRVIELLQKIVGGQVGPVIDITQPASLPQKKTVTLRRAQIKRILGIEIDDDTVTQILTSLGMTVTFAQDHWQVTPPSYRFDIAIEADLIEELARIHGYAKIPEAVMTTQCALPDMPESQLALSRIRRLLVDRSYHEVVTFSFIDEDMHHAFHAPAEPIRLANPMTRELSVMRHSLWPGLINILRYNEHRQAQRIRLFETGMCFMVDEKGEWQQVTKLAGLIVGEAHTLQWAQANRRVDFYDIKGDIAALLALTRIDYRFETEAHPALHPGQCAGIYRDNLCVGYVGALHPRLVEQFDLKNMPYLFEVTLAGIDQVKRPHYQPISRFPSVRRDIAIIADQDLKAATLQQAVTATAGLLLNKVEIFDIYVGEGIELGKKSMALGLTFQDPSRTLIDEEINQIIERVITDLVHKFNVKLRA